MFERDFKSQVEQLYRETPTLPDEHEFLKTLEARLELESRRRRRVLAGCGLIGACVSLGALWRVDAPGLLRFVATNLLQSLERGLASIDTTDLGVLGGALVLALLLRELIRAVSESPS